jgi:hypothetical protein
MIDLISALELRLSTVTQERGQLLLFSFLVLFQQENEPG